MSEMPAASWSIVGAGNVGGALIDMAAKPEVAAGDGLETTPQYVLRSDGWHEGSPDGPLAMLEPFNTPSSDVLFIAAPSTGDHEPMLSLMRTQLEIGGTVVTCEKGVLAEHFEELTTASGELGYWATVGGGTKLVQKLELDATDPQNIKELHLATNATLTYIFHGVASGGNLDEVVDAAGKLGYAEPGATGVYDVIFNEAAYDVPRKTAIVLQTIFPEMVGLELDDMATELSEDDVLKALNEANRYRYLVSVFPEAARTRADRLSDGRLGGFAFEREGWIVIGGLQRVDHSNSLSEFKAITGAGAGYYIDTGPLDKSMIDGDNLIKGTGAGGAVTAAAMLNNYRHLPKQP